MRKIRRAALAAGLSLLLCSAAAVRAEGRGGPVAENLELETYRGVSVGGQLSARSREEEELRYQISTQPSKGQVELESGGHFIYTPEEGRRGRDYFGYKAVDSAGRISQEATVIIRLRPAPRDFRYRDTAGLACDYAAHALARAGLWQGQLLGGQPVFEPERPMSRGEFLTLAMDCAGEKPLRGVESTGFRDDEAIGPWLRPYVSAALLAGYTEGLHPESAAVFAAAEPLSREEAAVLLCRIFSLSPAPGAGEEESAARAFADLRASGILREAVAEPEAALSRGEAAVLLCRAMESAGSAEG